MGKRNWKPGHKLPLLRGKQGGKLVYEYWFRFRGSKTWHRVLASGFKPAILKFARGSKASRKDILTRTTRPPVGYTAQTYTPR